MKRNWKPGEEPLRGDIFLSAAQRSTTLVVQSVRVELNVVLHSDDVSHGGLPVMVNLELHQLNAEPVHIELDVALDDALTVIQALLKYRDVILTAKKTGWLVLRGQVVVDPTVKLVEEAVVHEPDAHRED